MFCESKCTPEKKHHGYDDKIRKQAIRLYIDSMNMRQTARHLGVHHRTVSVWVREHVSNLPPSSTTQEGETAEMDELFSFIGNKKTKST